MFDALKGLKEALSEKERIPEHRRELSTDAVEELNRTLVSLEKSQLVTVVYYCEYEHAYQQLTGPVKKIDPYWELIYVGDTGIEFREIGELIVM